MRLTIALLAAGLCACLAPAEPYWVSYDADDGRFPEEVGWTRHTHGGGAVRSLADGILTLDSTASSMICDYYEMDHPTTPGPGETFVAEWRVRVAQHSGFWEALTYVRGDAGDDVLLGYTMDHLRSWDEGWSVPIAPGLFHTYRLESADLHAYSLWIDSAYVRSGVFEGPGAPIPWALFGDISYGTTPCVSLTEWDFFSFGVVLDAEAGDLNCDGVVDAFDIDAFVMALTDPDGYTAAFADCDMMLADVNGDGLVNAFDIDPFVELLIGGLDDSSAAR